MIRRRTVWLAVAVFLFPLGVIFLQRLDSTFHPDADADTAFLAMPALAAWFVAAVVLSIHGLVTRSWMRGVGIAAAALLVRPCAGPVAVLPDYVRLARTWSTCMRDVDVVRQTRFDWGSGGTVTTGFHRTLVYDPADGITKETFEPREVGSSETITVHHLVRHFCLVEEVS